MRLRTGRNDVGYGGTGPFKPVPAGGDSYSVEYALIRIIIFFLHKFRINPIDVSNDRTNKRRKMILNYIRRSSLVGLAIIEIRKAIKRLIKNIMAERKASKHNNVHE